MDFEREILDVLREAGQTGLPVKRIALNVFNITNSLFNPLDPEKVYAEVSDWLRTESAKSGASIEKTDTRGWYRLNLNSQKVQQLLMEFLPNEEDEWMM